MDKTHQHKCKKCGWCCSHFEEDEKTIPIKNGVCIYLKNNKCTIYKKRFKICREYWCK